MFGLVLSPFGTVQTVATLASFVHQNDIRAAHVVDKVQVLGLFAHLKLDHVVVVPHHAHWDISILLFARSAEKRVLAAFLLLELDASLLENRLHMGQSAVFPLTFHSGIEVS